MSTVTAEAINTILAERYSTFREWCDALVDDSRGGSRAQPVPTPEIRQWINVCRDGGVSLCEYLVDRLGLSSHQIALLDDWPSPGPMTVNEFANPPREKERLIADRLDSLTQAHAAQPLFWTLTSVAGFKHGRLTDDHAKWMAKKQDWRRATRDALRRIGGAAVEARGRLGVFLDHTVSRAWWRVKLAESVASYSGLEVDAVHRELRTHTWSELAEASASKLTVMCDPYLRAGVVATFMSSEGLDQRKKRRRIEQIARESLTYCSALRHGVGLDPSERDD